MFSLFFVLYPQTSFKLPASIIVYIPFNISRSDSQFSSFFSPVKLHSYFFSLNIYIIGNHSTKRYHYNQVSENPIRYHHASLLCPPCALHRRCGWTAPFFFFLFERHSSSWPHATGICCSHHLNLNQVNNNFIDANQHHTYR